MVDPTIYTAFVVRYIRPSWFTTNVWNRVVALAMGLGISVYGSRVLAVRGRVSGEWRSTPVNVLSDQGERYLVAPRGETQWVRNVRAGGEVELRLGRRREAIRVAELKDDVKPPVLREYLRRWGFEVGLFFQGLGADATDDQLRRIAPGYPVFRIKS